MSAQLVVLVVQVGLTLLTMLAVFGVENQGSYAVLVGLVLMNGCAGMCYGELSRNRQEVKYG